MAVTMFLELPGASTEQYDQINEAMGVHGPEDEPDALISHVCAVVDGGLMIFDVWRSQEDLDDFLENRVGPAAQHVGVEARPPRFGSVHYQLGTR
jgi:hypothetical protein